MAVWYGTDDEWPYRLEVDSNPDLILVDPEWVLLFLSPVHSNFWSNVDTNGADIRVTLADKVTEIAHYVVDIDTVAEEGCIAINVSGNISTTVESTFYIYYGNESAMAYSASDTYGRNNVFDANTVACYSLTGADALTDLTGNGYDLTANNAPTSGVSGPMEGTEAYTFAGGSSQSLSGSAPVTTWPASLISMFNISSAAANAVIMALSDSTDTDNYFRILHSTHPRAQGTAIGDGGAGSVASLITTLSTSTWYMGVTSRTGTTGTTVMAVVDVGSTSDSTAISAGSFDTVSLGGFFDSTPGDYFTGSLAWSYVRDEAVTANYYNTRYDNFTASVNPVLTFTQFWRFKEYEAWIENCTGYSRLTDVTSAAAGGTINFTNLANAGGGVFNGAFAEVLSEDTSYRVFWTNPGDGLDEVIGNTVVGLEFRIILIGEDGTQRSVYPSSIRFVKADAVVGTEFGPDNGGSLTDNLLNFRAYGGSTELGGVSWTDAEVTHENTGIALQFYSEDLNDTDVILFQADMRVYYSEASATESGFFSLMEAF